MKGRVLIIGNGISRLSYTSQILAYPGEVWGCNFAFREFPDKITRLCGHEEPMIEAQEWKDIHGKKFQIWSGPMTKHHPDWNIFTVGAKWLRDSGTTLVAEALYCGFEVDLVGFDMGGPDVLSPNMHKNDKSNWLDRWVEIIKEWGPDGFHFWGYDHKPYLTRLAVGIDDRKKYAREYLKRKPHIDTLEYRDIHKEFTMKKKEQTPEKMIRIRYNDGYETVARESIANLTIAKGKAVLLVEVPGGFAPAPNESEIIAKESKVMSKKFSAGTSEKVSK